MKLHIADVHVFREVNSIVDLQKLCNAARHLQCESTPPPGFSDIFPKLLGIFNQFLTHLLYVHIYARLQIFIQLPPILTKLCHTT